MSRMRYRTLMTTARVALALALKVSRLGRKNRNLRYVIKDISRHHLVLMANTGYEAED